MNPNDFDQNNRLWISLYEFMPPVSGGQETLYESHRFFGRFSILICVPSGVGDGARRVL